MLAVRKTPIDCYGALHDNATIICLLQNTGCFRVSSERPYAGTEVVKEVVGWCANLEHPDRIHAQKMRTYLATTCQVRILYVFHV